MDHRQTSSTEPKPRGHFLADAYDSFFGYLATMKAFSHQGMQVHAVPEEERAYDATGKRLPWGYSYADASLNRKAPAEKGPFGRVPTRRASTRKATTPAAGTSDRTLNENLKYYDELFGKLKQEQEELHPAPSRPELQPSLRPSLSHRPTLDNLAPGATQQAPASAAPATSASFKEPTEVMIYGFGSDHQYQALTFFERASNGHIYEDYDRQAVQPRFQSALSQPRGAIPRSLPREAIRKINTYLGGEHWIKVTFDSPHAAELACHASPHNINGYTVRAEMWRGVPPAEDAPLPASGVRDTRTLNARQLPRATRSARSDFRTLPNRMPGAPVAFGAAPTSGLQTVMSNISPEDDPFVDLAGSNGSNTTSTTASAASAATTTTASASTAQTESGSTASTLQPASSSTDGSGVSTALPIDEPKPLRIRGATRVQLRSADQALAAQPHWQTKAFGGIPIIGPLFFGGETSGNVIGSEAPRDENGNFDSERASAWWRFAYTIDSTYGSDLCGLKGDE